MGYKISARQKIDKIKATKFNSNQNMNDSKDNSIHNNKKLQLNKILHILSFIILMIGTYLLIDLLWISPMKSNNAMKKIQQIYEKSTPIPEDTIAPQFRRQLMIKCHQEKHPK